MQIIGVDCSTTLRNVGLARARLDGEQASVSEVRSGTADLVRAIVEWIGSTRTLICLDAPLGWPAAFERLAKHRAGDVVETSRETTFNRETDRVVASLIKQTPLRVGADRIAMTAHWTLQMLTALRQTTGLPITLAWESDFQDSVAAIEVYPAATLRSHGIRCSGYKDGTQGEERSQIVDSLMKHMDVDAVKESISDSADLLDAAVCCLAGADFLAGRAIGPTLSDTIQKEGWIWVRRPNGSNESNRL